MHTHKFLQTVLLNDKMLTADREQEVMTFSINTITDTKITKSM